MKEFNTDTLNKCKTWAEMNAKVFIAVDNKKIKGDKHIQDCSDKDLVAECEMLRETISAEFSRQKMELDSIKRSLAFCETTATELCPLIYELDEMRSSLTRFIICAIILNGLGIAMVGILMLLVIGGI